MPRVKVTRKYQVTIPAEIRKPLGIRVGDTLEVLGEGGRVILRPTALVSDPVGYLWSLADQPLSIDAVKLVEESWAKTHPPNLAEVLKRVKARRRRLRHT